VVEKMLHGMGTSLAAAAGEDDLFHCWVPRFECDNDRRQRLIKS
jgi:hypothetical protein